jgi:hypothetical protein
MFKLILGKYIHYDWKISLLYKAVKVNLTKIETTISYLFSIICHKPVIMSSENERTSIS